MSSGVVSVKTVAWTGNFAAFKTQFPAFIQQSGHIKGLKYNIAPGLSSAQFHDQDGIAKNTPSHDELADGDLTDDEVKSQIFVRSQLLLASDNPIWLSIFRKISASSKYCGTNSYVAVLNRYAPASAGQRSKIRQKITNMSHMPPELAIDFIIRMETENEELKALDDPGYTDGALADLILTKIHDVYDPLRNQIYARANPDDLEAIRIVFIQQGPRFDAQMEALRNPSSGAALAAVNTDAYQRNLTPPPARRNALICWQCGGPHGKRDSRERGWQPCIEFCKTSGKEFRPPGRGSGVAAIAASADIYDVPPAPHAFDNSRGFSYMASNAQDICDIPTNAYVIDCAASFSITGYISDIPDNHAPDNVQISGLGHADTQHSRSTKLSQIKLNLVAADNTIVNSGNFTIRYVPDLAKSPVKRLISVSETMRLCGWRFAFNTVNDSYVIIDNKTIPLHYAPQSGLLYITPVAAGTALFSYTKATPDKNLWHHRLGHLSISLMDKTLRSTSSTGMNFSLGDSDNFCEVCASSKARAEKYNRALTDISNLGVMERMQWDLWGPLPVVSYGGTRFVSSMVDMASGVCILLNIAFKDDAIDNHLKLVIATANLFGHTIKTIRSDNDRALADNKTARQIMLDNKITVELTGRDNHHRIGGAERRWQTLHSMALSMLRHACLGLEFMSFAIQCSNYILNRVYSDSKQCIPFAKLSNAPSVDLGHLRIFGCPCYVQIAPAQRKKFENKTVKGIFIGYYSTDGDYLVWNPETKHTLHSRSVQFHEHWRPIGDPSAGPSTGIPHWTPVHQLQRAEKTAIPATHSFYDDSVIKRITQDDIINEHSSTVDDTALHSPSSIPAATADHDSTTGNNEIITQHEEAPDSTDDYSPSKAIPAIASPAAAAAASPSSPRKSTRTTTRHDYHSANARGFGLTALGAHHGIGPVPKGISQAFRSSEREQWRAARDSEQKSLASKNVFGPPVLLPAGKRAIPMHYVFDRKYNKDGSINKHKIRAVADGDKQIYGIDFFETFAPCTRFATFRLFFAYVAALRLTTASFDVKTAYLNAELKEEVYVKPLPVFPDETPDPNHVGKVFRLQRALYGLRQAGREWFIKFKETMKELGFVQSPADPGIYIKYKDGLIDVILIVYVDDIIAAGHGDTWIEPLCHQLEEHFEIVYDGEANWCLGMGIDHNSDGSIKIHQSKYIDDMLNNFNMTDSNPVATPMLVGYVDDADSPPASDDIPYASLVGSLNYAAVCTRPDISYAVSVLSKHLKNPTLNHWQAAKRVLRYLKGTKDYGLTYDAPPSDINVLTGYCDASYASTSDARSVSGSCFLFNMAAILWSASTQKAVATSTAESEYYSLGTACQDAVFLRELLATIDLQQEHATVIYEDNTACLAIANNPLTSKKARHIKVKYHFVRQLIGDKEIELKYKPTDDMLADIFTKPLDSEKHSKFTCLIMNIKNKK